MSAPRIACAHLSSLPLQVLRRAHPSWDDAPVVVVDSDKPTARITFADPRALALGVIVGMRYATAQSLIPGLRAGVVDDARIRAITDELVQGLIRLTPRVEPADPGVLFLDPSGTGGLYGDLSTWAETIVAYVEAQRYRVVLVVGFSRDRVLALARSTAKPGVHVVADQAREIALAQKLPLASLGASPQLVHDLGRLDIKKVGELGRLPPLELAMRFGPEALALHDRATARVTRPFTAAREYEPIRLVLEVDPPDDDVGRLLFGLKRGFDELTAELRARGELLVTAILELGLDHAPTRTETLRPAKPGLDVAPLLELFRLRLERQALEAKIVEVVLRCESVRAHGRQLDLTFAPKTRDAEAASRAVARLAALLGPERVTRLSLRDAHLPEAKVVHTQTTTIDLPRLVGTHRMMLVRRRRATPTPLAGTRAPLAAQPLGPSHAHGETLAMLGPYRVSGGWWVREVMRDYYFVETSRGTILWVYRDGARKRWFAHGEVD